MRCKGCDYRLWNLTERRCPECGRPFVPSEFEFTPNSVRFCCPHCGQDYYGTDANGHLEPSEFDCVTCGQHIHMDEMVLLPTEGVHEDQTRAHVLPWLERSKIGFVRGWFRTIGMAMVKPAEVMEALPRTGSLLSAWWFALLTNTLIVVVSIIPIFAFGALMSLGTGMPGVGGLAVMFLAPVGFGIVFGVVAFAIAMLLWGLIAHGVLRLTGRVEGTLGRTYAALCYSSGANILSAIPMCGAYFGWIWPIVSGILMIRKGHNVHGGRAAAAVLTLPVLSILAIVGLYIVMFYMMFTQAGPFAMAGTTSPTNQTSQVLVAVQDYTKDHGGGKAGLPVHAIQLLDTGDLAKEDLDDPATNFGMTEGLLGKWEQSSASQRDEIVEEVVEAMDDAVIAHRLGDFVFTYHGIDPIAGDGELWLVIYAPSPAQAQGLPPGLQSQFGLDKRTVGLVDGTIINYSLDEFEEAFDEQNILRDIFELPPLPYPDDLTVEEPLGTRDGELRELDVKAGAVIPSMQWNIGNPASP